MSIVVQIHRDRSGCVLVETDPRFELVGRFMELRFAGSATACEEMLGVIEKVRLHRSCSFIILGCVIAVTITATGAVFRTIQKPVRTCEITLEEFEDVLRRWQAAQAVI